MAYFCVKCSQLFHSKDAAGCMQCNPDWGGDESLVGYLSAITHSENPNVASREAAVGQVQYEFEYVLRTGT